MDVQQQLSQFLFCYHTTPHSMMGVPPTQLLMGRCLQTHLDLMRPSVASQVTGAQARQKLVMTRRANTDSSHWVTQYLFGTLQPAQRG